MSHSPSSLSLNLGGVVVGFLFGLFWGFCLVWCFVYFGEVFLFVCFWFLFISFGSNSFYIRLHDSKETNKNIPNAFVVLLLVATLSQCYWGIVVPLWLELPVAIIHISSHLPWKILLLEAQRHIRYVCVCFVWSCKPKCNQHYMTFLWMA